MHALHTANGSKRVLVGGAQIPPEALSACYRAISEGPQVLRSTCLFFTPRIWDRKQPPMTVCHALDTRRGAGNQLDSLDITRLGSATVKPKLVITPIPAIGLAHSEDLWPPGDHLLPIVPGPRNTVSHSPRGNPSFGNRQKLVEVRHNAVNQ